MKRRKFIKISSIGATAIPIMGFCINSCTSNIGSEDVYLLFQNPLQSAGVFVRWWWNGNKITEAEIIRELDILKQAGIRGIEINPIAFPGNDSISMGIESLDWLSDGWVKMVEVCLREATKRDITCDLLVGSGWPFGGKFLPREHQTQTLIPGNKRLKGPGQVSYLIEDLCKDTIPNTGTFNKDEQYELFDIRLVNADMNEFDAGTKLISTVKEGSIRLDIPEGNYVLYYLVLHTGYQNVIHGSPGADGPVVNHYNETAVKSYLENMTSGLFSKLGELPSNFRSMFIDSIELDGANWAEDMPEQFIRRRGYDVRDYLPFILFKTGALGLPVEGSQVVYSSGIEDMIRRVRYDYEITRIELFKERFIIAFHQWCKGLGLKSRMQAYGHGCHPVDANLEIDIPECETWLFSNTGTTISDGGMTGKGFTMSNKFVSSGARLSGKRIVSCEEFTNTSMVFNATMAQLKVASDMSIISGVTHSVLHGFNYSPPEVPFPGWVRYGTYFNEQNTWWPYFKNWVNYKTRLSSVFQSTELFSSVAVFHPLADLWSYHGTQRDPFPRKKRPTYAHSLWEAIHKNGNGCDLVSDLVVQQSEIINRMLIFGPRKYTALLMMEVESLEPETAEKIKRFAEAGGTVVFLEHLPSKSAGFLDYEVKDERVRELMKQVVQWSPGCVVQAPENNGNLIIWYAGIQQKFNIKPYLRMEKPVDFINQVYYRGEKDHIFFIANYSLERNHFTKVEFFEMEGKTPWIWDPHTGERYIYPHSKETPGSLELHFGPCESKLIVYNNDSKGEIRRIDFPDCSNPFEITSGWEVKFYPVAGEPFSQKWDKLIDFKEDELLSSLAGEIQYETEFQIEDRQEYMFINVGNVNHGITELWLNGEYLGVQWYGDRIYNVRSALKNGSNTLKIKLVNVLGNYMKSLKDNFIAQRWTDKQPIMSSGMIGPVSLMKSA
jgi:hypothetical protein